MLPSPLKEMEINMNILNKIFTQIPKSKYLNLLPSFKNERNQKFITITLTLFTLSFFGLFAISPTLSTITKLKKELEDDKFVDQQLKQKVSNLTLLQQRYSLLQNDIPFVLDAIPQKPEISLLLAQIQAIANKNNIDLKTLQNFQVELFPQQNQNKQYYSYAISLSGNGTSQNISAFIADLTNIQRILTLETFSITSTEDKNNLLQLSLRGSAYYKM